MLSNCSDDAVEKFAGEEQPEGTAEVRAKEVQEGRGSKRGLGANLDLK